MPLLLPLGGRRICKDIILARFRVHFVVRGLHVLSYGIRMTNLLKK